MDSRGCRAEARAPSVRDATLRIGHDAGGDRRRDGHERDAGQGSSAVRLVAAPEGAWGARSMSKPRDDWDADERDALDGLEAELAEIRRRHQDDPSLAMLRAADADALPPDAAGASHAAPAGQRVEPRPGRRLCASGRRRPPRRRVGRSPVRPHHARRAGRHAASTVVETRDDGRRSCPRRHRVDGGGGVAPPDDSVRLRNRAGAQVSPGCRPAPAPFLISYTKPEVKLSPAALTWRGDARQNPFLGDSRPRSTPIGPTTMRERSRSSIASSTAIPTRSK